MKKMKMVEKKFFLSLIGGIVGVFVMVGATQKVFGEATTVTVTGTLESACALSANSLHSSTAVDGGSLKNDFGTVNLSVTCNDSSKAWKLYALGNGDGATKTSLHYVDGSDSSNDIATGTATSGSTSNWAFKGGSLSSYQAIPSTNTIVSTGTGNSGTIAMNYRLFVSSTQVAGDYRGKVKYTVVKPGSTTYDLSSISYMQDMDTEVCENSTTGMTADLIDSRDGKIYSVAKLADGNCWMTQNLALGGSSAITLTSSDSDVSSNFTLPASATWSDTSYDGIHVYNPYPNQSDDTNKYGAYYTWNAAVAGTGTGMTSNDATSSICPKGWQLPTNTNSTTAGVKSYDNLLAAYDIDITDNYNGDFFTKLSAFNPALSGDFLPLGSAVLDNGYFTFLWSSTARSSYYAYIFFFYSNGYFFPTYYVNKYYGNSIRCVAR